MVIWRIKQSSRGKAMTNSQTEMKHKFFFERDKNNPTIFIFSRAKSLKVSIIIAIFLNIITVLFFAWALLITSRQRTHWYEMFTLHGILMTIVAWFWLIFFSRTLVYITTAEYKKKSKNLPLFLNIKLNAIGALTTTVIYILLILKLWVPAIPESEKDLLVIKVGVPIFLIAIVSPTILTIWLSYLFLSTYSTIEISSEAKVITIKGRTALGKTFNFRISLQPNTKILLMRYDKEKLKLPYELWGIFLETETHLYRLYSGSRDQVLQFTNEIISITQLPYIETAEITSSKLTDVVTEKTNNLVHQSNN